METNNVSNSINKKTEFAFSAIMFFAPLIKANLKSNNKLSKEDKIFVNWYIKFWYINIILLLIAIVLWVLQFTLWNLILKKISIGIFVLLALLLVVWTILISLWKNINNSNSLENLEWDVDFNRLFYFIPVYNIYLWYKDHQFEWEHSMIKCGIFLRSIFVLMAIFVMNNYVNAIVLILILFVIVCNVSWIKFWSKRDKFFNKVFFKNPEEIWWYVSGTFFSLFNKKWLKDNIIEQKKQFEFLFKTDNKQIIFEYILMLLLCLCGMYVWIKNKMYFLFIADVLIILRYFIMFVRWKHLPHLPIFRWISSAFFSLNITKNE